MALTMDVLKPETPNGIGILFMVSGGFNSDVSFINEYFGEQFKAFTDRGDTVFLVCHGSQPKFHVNEIVQDIHRAVRFVRFHAKDYGVDPNRLGISGLSSGGYLSLTLGTTGQPGDPEASDPVDRESSRVQAVACFFPPTDLVDYGEVGRSFLEFELLRDLWNVFGIQNEPREEQIRILKQMSPFYAITADTAPTLIIHGDADEVVPYEQAERFDAKLAEMNVPHQLIRREGAGHGWSNDGEDWALLADWFDQYL
jgi:acetyl esterase/lipase